MNIKALLLAFLVSSVSLLAGNDTQSGRTSISSVGPQWSEAEKDTQREAAGRLLVKIREEIIGGKKDLTIPAGNYRFDKPAKDVEFTDLSDVAINAQGVVFWFDSGTGKKVRFKRCRNVTIRGLTVDTDPLPWFQGIITSVDRKTRTMEFQSDAGYQVPEGKRLEGGKRVMFFDGQTSLELPVFDDRVMRMENLGGGKIRIAKFDNERIFLDPVVGREVRAGDRVAVLLEQDTGGGVESIDCAGMRLEDITLYGAGGFAYHEARGEGGNTYLRCKLVRRPGTNRLIASPRDCFHSYLVERGPIIKDCEFSFAADDLIAIHGFFGVVLKKYSPREYLVISPYGNVFRKDSAVEIFNPVSGVSRGRVAITDMEEDLNPETLKTVREFPETTKAERNVSIRTLNEAHVFKLTLDRDCDAETNDLLSCPAYSGAGAVVENNSLHDGHVRGILAKTENLLIRNNVIERTGHGGIVLMPEYYWLEGPVNSDIRVVGNRLSRNGWSTYDRAGLTSSIAGIEVSHHLGKRLFPRTLIPGYFNFGVEIRDNIITQPAGFGILVTNTAGVTVVNNVVREPFSAGPRPRFYTFSKMVDSETGFTKEQVSELDNPYYGIWLFTTKDAVVGGNSCEKRPPFLKGGEGFANSPGLKRTAR
jgi:hypothetical protein